MKGSPKYLDLMMEALKSMSGDLKSLAGKVSDMNLELVTVKSEIVRNNEHMAKYNDQLEIHIKGTELAHKRHDSNDIKVMSIQNDLQDVQDQLTNKLDLVYKHIEEERQEKDIRKKLEDESSLRREKWYKNLRLLTLLAGTPLAVYGLLKFLSEILNRLHLFFQ